jgi:exopolysaccharide production protein ExoQ
MNETRPLALPTIAVLIVAFALVGPVLSMAPLGVAPLLIAAAVIATGTERVWGGRWPSPPFAATLAAIALIAWCALSLIWDIQPADGARKLVDLVITLASLLAVLGLAPAMDDRQQRHIAMALVAGVSVGLIVLCVETGFDFPLYRAVMGSGDPRLIGGVEAKRATDALPLAVWPAALALVRLGKMWLGAALAVVFTGTCAVLTASSATLGMAVSLVVLVLAVLSVVWTRRLLALAVILAFALIIPGSIYAYRAGASTSHMVKASGRHRTEIWDFAARKSLDRPLFGHGFNSSRFVPNDGEVSQFLGPGHPIIPLHPHNGYLQIWLELGAAGVLIVGGALFTMLRATVCWPTTSSRFTLAGYAAALVVAGLAFGIWQTWWMATLAFSVAAYRIVAMRPGVSGQTS